MIQFDFVMIVSFYEFRNLTIAEQQGSWIESAKKAN